jgi:hypothetical protein
VGSGAGVTGVSEKRASAGLGLEPGHPSIKVLLMLIELIIGSGSGISLRWCDAGVGCLRGLSPSRYVLDPAQLGDPSMLYL